MLFKAAVLEQIAAGRVDLAFRRWSRPTVRAGSTLRTPIGVLAIVELQEIGDAELTEEDARRAGHDNRDTLLAELDKASAGLLYRIAFQRAGDDPRAALRDRDEVSEVELAELRQRLGPAGSWATECLRLIGQREGRTAGELAELLGFEKAALKRRILGLKELGLTESLQNGYRLSRRGRALLAALGAHPRS